MIDSGGFDLRNLLQGHTLAVLLVYVAALIALGLIAVSFRGSVVV